MYNCNSRKRRKTKESKRNIWGNDTKNFTKFIIDTIHRPMKLRENYKQVEYQSTCSKAYHIQMIKNQTQREKSSKKAEEKKILPIEEQNKNYAEHLIRNHAKKEESKRKYLALKEKT